MSSNFLQINPTEYNQETDSEYLGDSLRSGGIPVGSIIPSAFLNKALYQCSIMVAALAQFMVTQGYSAEDANYADLIVNLSAAIRGEAAIITSVTANANTTAGQNLINYPLPAGALNTLGRIVRLTMGGTLVANGAENVTFQFSVLGGAVIIALPGAATYSWRATVDLITTVIGSSGNILTSSELLIANGSTGVGLSTVTTYTSTVDLLLAINLQSTVQFSVASGSNSCTQDFMVAQQITP